MYTITKRFAFSASHVIGGLPADHPCGRLHGHNYQVEVSLQSPTLDTSGFVRDFHELSALQDFVSATVDHKHLNEVFGHDRTNHGSYQPMAVRLVQGTLAGSGGGTGERDAGLLGRISTMRESIPISEIFGPTVQGEGPLIGRPTVFVRTGGCDYRCVWCDTLYAVLPEHRSEWVLMAPTEIARRIDELAGNDPVLVTLSGGNP